MQSESRVHGAAAGRSTVPVAVAVADAVADGDDVGDTDGGTIIDPSTLNANCPEFAVHKPLANLKLHGSAHGLARPSTGHVQRPPPAEVDHFIVDAEPETTSAYRVVPCGTVMGVTRVNVARAYTEVTDIEFVDEVESTVVGK